MSAVETHATIEGLLREAHLPPAEAEILLRSALDCERSHLIAHPDQTIDPYGARSARDWFARRRAGEPVSYIIGWREFYGVRLRVTPQVLIPRPETEQLVELALERLTAASSARVLDLGTGSGAIAIALATLRPGLKIVATDVSQAALTVAHGNAREHAVGIEFKHSDWFDSIEGDPFDLIVSNPPYVATTDPHLERGDVRFEPRLALVGGPDGLECVRSIATGARDHLVPGGSLLLEHGYDQGEDCIATLRELGYAEVADFSDLAGHPRACVATWRG